MVIILFRKIEIEDVALFRRFHNNKEYIGSELNFANIIAWKELDDLSIYHDDEMLLVKGRDFFFPPLVLDHNYEKAIRFIQEYCSEHDFPFNIYGITQEFLPYFKMPNTIIYPHTELNEYLYTPNDLITYSGKKLHSKRNLLNQFEKNYAYGFVTYNEDLRIQVLDLVDLWTDHKSLTYEKEGIMTLLDHLSELECFCDCILIEGKVEAFSISTLFNNTGIVLFEKANTNFVGIYSAIVTYVARKHFSECNYVNRQEDMGIENLRQSKMSYRPVDFVYKYQLTYTIDHQLRTIYEEAFEDSETYTNYFFTKKEKEVRYSFFNNSITSSLYFKRKYIGYQDQLIPSIFIFGAATSKVYKNSGYMKRLLLETFEELRDQVSVVYLHAAVQNFYERFDFVRFGYSPKEIIGDYQENSNWDFATLLSLYQEFQKKFDFSTKRTLEELEKEIEEILLDGGKITLYEKDGIAVGYTIYDSQTLLESCLVTEDITSDETYNHIRIINLKNFLNQTHYVPTRNLKVIDSFLPSNNVKISINDGPVETLSIQEFTKELLNQKTSLVFEKY